MANAVLLAPVILLRFYDVWGGAGGDGDARRREWKGGVSEVISAVDVMRPST